MRASTNSSRETNIRQKRLKNTKRGQFISKDQKRPIYTQRDLYASKPTYLHKKRLIIIKTDLHVSKKALVKVSFDIIVVVPEVHVCIEPLH